MQQKIHSKKLAKRRKSLMVLPLVALPFITVLFWSLGGGKTSVSDVGANTQKGFNMVLPDAILEDDKPSDKMSYYDKAASDSARLREQMKNDPFYQNYDAITTAGKTYNDTSLNKRSNYQNLPSYAGGLYSDLTEAKVYRKLDELNSALNNTSRVPPNIPDNAAVSATGTASVNKADVDRLEQMMQTMNEKDGNDPEVSQLNSMLEKILDIQHPDLVRERIRQSSEVNKGHVFAVSASAEPRIVSLLDTSRRSQATSNRFHSIDEKSNYSASANAIEAVVHETQTLVDGSTVKLRLISDIFINGTLIPKNNFLFGMASLNGERLTIKINSFRYINSIYPVDLSVYDVDGMEGVFIPGAISRDVAKQSSERAIQNIGLTTLDPSLKMQAAAAGIEAAKGLLSKKVKLIKVTVKAGYQVLLRDEKQKQNS